MESHTLTATLKNIRKVFLPTKYERLEYNSKLAHNSNQRKIGETIQATEIMPMPTETFIGYTVPFLH